MLSLRIIYVLEFVVHHQSDKRIITLVSHADGVNENHVLFALSVQLDHELVEYATAALGDG